MAPPASPARAVHLVETDAYDRDALARALGAGVAGKELLEAGGRVLPHFRELVDDLFAVLFKLVVRLVPDPPASTALNRRLLGAVLGGPGAAELRAACALDETRAAAGALTIARVVLQEVRRGELLGEEELLDLKLLQRAEEREGELDGAAEALREPQGDTADKLRATLAREQERRRAQSAALAERVARSLEELPPGLEARVAQATAQAATGVEEDEDAARSFLEGVGGGVPGNAAERVALAEQLRGNDKLRRLAALAGAFRSEALAVRKRRIRRASSEVHRVGRGGDLARLLPVELAALSRTATRLDLLRRLAEHDLAQYELAGADRGGRGPLLICVDGSGSMSGARELWAKAVALALLEVARRQNRRAEALIFSGKDAPLARFSLLSGKPRGGGRRQADLSRVLEFAGCFPGGGTDFEKPLDAALQLLEQVPLRGGDVVFITDGEAPISDGFAAAFARARRERGFGVYGVIVDDPVPGAGASVAAGSARELSKVADRITTVTRLTSGAVRDLFERL